MGSKNADAALQMTSRWPSCPPSACLIDSLDDFGLPPKQSLLEDTGEVFLQRKAAEEALLGRVWETLVRRNGAEEARKMFLAQAQNGVRPAYKPKGSTNPQLDAYLLAEFDRRGGDVTPATIARELAEARILGKLDPNPFKKHETEGAIARRLSNALKKREQDQKKARQKYEEWQEAFREATGEYPPVPLLSQFPYLVK